MYLTARPQPLRGRVQRSEPSVGRSALSLCVPQLAGWEGDRIPVLAQTCVQSCIDLRVRTELQIEGMVALRKTVTSHRASHAIALSGKPTGAPKDRRAGE